MTRATALVLAALLLLGWPLVSRAEIYRWVDEHGVTNYTDGLDHVPSKYRSSAVPMGLTNSPSSAATSGGGSEGAEAGALGSARITFTPGREIVVDATLNGSTATKLLLDTGAQRSVISPRTLAAAGVALDKSQPGRIRGATGTAPVSTVQVDSVEVGKARVGALAVISHDIEHQGVDGLLGRDFLDQFKVSIDNKEGVVTLSPK